MNYIGKVYGDYKVIKKVSKDKYIFSCLKCGEEKEVFKTVFYRKPKCQKHGGRKNAVRLEYKGKYYSVQELHELTGYSIAHLYLLARRKQK